MDRWDGQAPDELAGALDDLSRLLLATGTLDDAMDRIARLAVVAIPACDTCSVSEVRNGQVFTRVATDPVAERIDNHQYDNNEGPCVAAIRTGVTCSVESMEAEERWPAFTEQATQEGLRSSYSVPLSVEDDTVGCLNLYSLDVSFGTDDQRISDAFGAQAAVTLANAEAYQRSRELIDNLQTALESRDVIGQAKGIVMERERCTADEAFDVLRSVSQSRNIKLRDLARRVVETGSWTDFPG